jgi:NTP pyrophosphatase (non-canonical NTP hydrolase)
MSPKSRVTNVEPEETAPPLTIAGFQRLIAEMYSDKDAARGIDGTFMWLMEEVGELAGSLRQGSREELAAEFADVLAWLVTIANVAGIDLEQAVLDKYGRGCPGCGQMVCRCDLGEKP